jgi:N-acetylneuraminate 9-O-acetyltransferase
MSLVQYFKKKRIKAEKIPDPPAAYYYKTSDFSMGRFCQMMWRLNFLCVLCCLVLNNSIMLYYICPMHTLFTIFVYAALGIGKQYNHTTSGIIAKIVACFVLVYLTFDLENVFYAIWSPLSFMLGYSDPRRPVEDTMHGEGTMK